MSGFCALIDLMLEDEKKAVKEYDDFIQSLRDYEKELPPSAGGTVHIAIDTIGSIREQEANHFHSLSGLRYWLCGPGKESFPKPLH